jgi:DsbC/DsbD-like thiol-disulfide interchange protein
MATRNWPSRKPLRSLRRTLLLRICMPQRLAPEGYAWKGQQSIAIAPHHVLVNCLPRHLPYYVAAERRVMIPGRALVAVVLGLAALMSQPTGATADAAGWVEVHGSKMRLVGGQPGPGATHYYAGVEISLADGWKTYWRMPGDSGVPPTFDWSGSRNLESANVLYPAPSRLPEAGGEAVGYKGAVTFPIAVGAKDPKAPVSLRLALEFGICREICIPAMLNLSLELAPGSKVGGPTTVSESLKRVPRTHSNRQVNDPELKQARLVEDRQPVRLEIEAVFKGGSATADAFVEAPEGLYVPMLKKQASSSSSSSRVRFETDLSSDLVKDLKGKTLVLTLVDDAGASEARWTFR